MKDDPKWQNSGYSPEKAWQEIKQAEVNRKYEKTSKSPLPMIALSAILLAASVTALLWAFWSVA